MTEEQNKENVLVENDNVENNAADNESGENESVTNQESDQEQVASAKENKQEEEVIEEKKPEVVFDPDFKGEPITVRSLLKAGAHFGHKTERWNPKMIKFIHGEKNGVHIINLDDTYKLWLKARKYIVDVASRGGNVLFVGTKQQARDIVANSAKLCDSSYVNNRWLGGTLSNFQTIKNSMRRLKNLEELLESATDETSKVKIAKKERLEISRHVEKLEHNLGGLRKMRTLPDVIFIVDIKKESIAVAEARKLHIPVVALVDTNVDPQKVEIGIPSNDDAYKTIKIFLEGLAEAVIEGKKVFKSRMSEQSKINAKASSRGGKKKEVEVNSNNESAAGQM